MHNVPFVSLVHISFFPATLNFLNLFIVVLVSPWYFQRLFPSIPPRTWKPSIFMVKGPRRQDAQMVMSSNPTRASQLSGILMHVISNATRAWREDYHKNHHHTKLSATFRRCPLLGVHIPQDTQSVSFKFSCHPPHPARSPQWCELPSPSLPPTIWKHGKTGCPWPEGLEGGVDPDWLWPHSNLSALKIPYPCELGCYSGAKRGLL